MASSRKTLILDNIISTVGAIAAGATYERTVKTASRNVRNIAEHPAYDVVYIDFVTEEKEPLLNAATDCFMTVSLACFVHDSSDLAKATDDIAADVERALAVDITRGGYAVDTRVTSVEAAVINAEYPYGACLLQVAVHYRHAEGNPYSAV